MLALVGSGEYLPAMQPVDGVLLQRLRSTPRVACLPTAAGAEGAERIAYWSRLGVEHFTRLGAQAEALPIIDRASAHDARLAATLADCNFVYFSGGKPDYLYASLVDSPAWESIRAVLQAGGIVAGCSAGAMIMGAYIMGLPARRPGFGLIPDAVIMPHYDEMAGLLRAGARQLIGRGQTLIGIEGYTALLWEAGQAEVLGRGGVTIWNSRGKNRYVQGEKPVIDWL